MDTSGFSSLNSTVSNEDLILDDTEVEDMNWLIEVPIVVEEGTRSLLLKDYDLD